jgi:hypothetical protein
MRTIFALASAAFIVVAADGRADEQADLQKVIDKAIKAHGVPAAKNKATVSKMKGKFYGMGDGIDFTADLKTQEPGQSRMDFALQVMGQTFEFIQTINGDKGWKSLGGNVDDLNKEEMEEAKEAVYAERVGRLASLKEKGYKLSALGDKKIGDRATVGIKVAHAGHRDVSLYFDKETGLLRMVERRAKDVAAGQEFNQETLYENYKAIDGVQQPHKLTINRDGKLFVEGEITDFKRLEELDASTFAKP